MVRAAEFLLEVTPNGRRRRGPSLGAQQSKRARAEAFPRSPAGDCVTRHQQSTHMAADRTIFSILTAPGRGDPAWEQKRRTTGRYCGRSGAGSEQRPGLWASGGARSRPRYPQPRPTRMAVLGLQGQMSARVTSRRGRWRAGSRSLSMETRVSGGRLQLCPRPSLHRWPSWGETGKSGTRAASRQRPWRAENSTVYMNLSSDAIPSSSPWATRGHQASPTSVSR